jgi:hypothetical protein
MEACPRCGFSYAWDGAVCGHCRYPDSPTEADRDNWMEARILAKARKHRLPGGRTQRFQDLAPERQAEMKEQAGSQLRGRPVLAFVDSSSRWTLLTTREVICQDTGGLRAVKIGELASVANASEPPAGATLEEVGRWKGSWEYLRVVDRGCHASLIWVPCGGEAYALWNILLPYASGAR